ncbi:MAG: hypothetical protein K6D93_07575 [Saccharofermentans sp.]|nr:hypothetical protein [Saccharofermentans sp.]
MKKKMFLMGLIMSLIISVAMGLLSSFLLILFNPDIVKSSPVPVIYLLNTLASLITGLIVFFVVPLGKLGVALTVKAGVRPPSLKFTLLNAIPMAVGNTVIISLVVSLLGVISARMKVPAEVLSTMPPMPVMWLGTWAKLLLPTLIASYILSVLISPLISKALGLGGTGPEGGAGKPPVKE